MIAESSFGLFCGPVFVVVSFVGFFFGPVLAFGLSFWILWTVGVACEVSDRLFAALQALVWIVEMLQIICIDRRDAGNLTINNERRHSVSRSSSFYSSW